MLSEARVVRAAPPRPHETENADQLPPRKHQPLVDLIEELDRILPFQYLSDFSHPSEYPGRHLDAVAHRWDGNRWPGPEIRLGDWFYPNTASRWSVFRGLATSSQVREMLKATGGYRPGQFIMQSEPLGPGFVDARTDPVVTEFFPPPEIPYRLSSLMYMLPPRPLAEHGGKFDGLYLVTLVDERYYWQYSSVSLRPTKDTTWQQLLVQCATALQIEIGTLNSDGRYGSPEPDSQLWTNEENAAFLFDAIAHNIGDIIVRQLDGKYNLFHPSESRTIAKDNRGNATRVARSAGGELFVSGTTKLPVGSWQDGDRTVSTEIARNSVLPASVQVTFPKYVKGDDPVPHFANPRFQNQRQSTWWEDSYGDTYEITVPLSSGSKIFAGNAFVKDPFAMSGMVGVAGWSQTIQTTAKAIYSGEAQLTDHPLNRSGLTNLAMQLATDYFKWQVMEALDEVYPGTYNWFMEGYHDVLWSWGGSKRQACTRVMRAPWNQVIPEMQHSANALSGYTSVPVGVGGKSVAQTWRDSQSGYTVETRLKANLTQIGMQISLNSIDNLPTEHRWKGKVQSGGPNEEIILFEGTSGQYTGIVDIVYRGIDGSLTVGHVGGAGAGESVIWQWPDTTYGVNLVKKGKGAFAFPGVWSSGGIAEVEDVQQTQTVRAATATIQLLNNVPHFSGEVYSYRSTDGALLNRETCWLRERNNAGVTAGKFYDGQLAGFSIGVPGGETSGRGVAPVYLVNQAIGGTVVGDDFSFVRNLSFHPDTDGYYSGLLQTKLADGKLQNTSPPQYRWLRDANNVNSLWLNEIYECTKTGSFTKTGDTARDVYTTKDYDLNVTVETAASGVLVGSLAPVMKAGLNPAWCWDFLWEPLDRTLHVARKFDVSDERFTPIYTDIAAEVFEPYWTWELTPGKDDGTVFILRRMTHQTGNVKDKEETKVENVWEVTYAPAFTWKMFVDDIAEPRGQFSITRLFAVTNNNASFLLDNIWKEEFNPYFTWNLTRLGDGYVGISRIFTVIHQGGITVNDVKKITFKPQCSWEVNSPGQGDVEIARPLDINLGSVKISQYTATVSFDSQDFNVTVGATSCDANVETKGLTDRRYAYHYKCVGTNLVQECAIVDIRHGLIKSWSDYTEANCPG